MTYKFYNKFLLLLAAFSFMEFCNFPGQSIGVSLINNTNQEIELAANNNFASTCLKSSDSTWSYYNSVLDAWSAQTVQANPGGTATASAFYYIEADSTALGACGYETSSFSNIVQTTAGTPLQTLYFYEGPGDWCISCSSGSCDTSTCPITISISTVACPSTAPADTVCYTISVWDTYSTYCFTNANPQCTTETCSCYNNDPLAVSSPICVSSNNGNTGCTVYAGQTYCWNAPGNNPDTLTIAAQNVSFCPGGLCTQVMTCNSGAITVPNVMPSTTVTAACTTGECQTLDTYPVSGTAVPYTITQAPGVSSTIGCTTGYNKPIPCATGSDVERTKKSAQSKERANHTDYTERSISTPEQQVRDERSDHDERKEHLL